MNLLAIDTSTHRLSVGVTTRLNPGSPHLRSGEGGAQASATLVPVVMEALASAGLTLHDLDAIVFGHGPGAFTGLRTATAVVQGLAYGTRSARHPFGLPVLGIDTLLAVADEARAMLQAQGVASDAPCVITALLDARMDEVYAATYVFDAPVQPFARLLAGPWLAKPDALADVLPTAAHAGWLAGNAHEAYGSRLPVLAARRGTEPHLACWPTAAALLRLAPSMLAAGLATAPAGAQPLYVRDQVAQTTQERAANAAAQLGTTPT